MKKVLSLSLLLCILTLSANAQRLIVRMDDIGATHSENVAVIKCYQEGVGTSAEIMSVCSWFPEAARMLNENPGLDVGVHVAFNSEWCGYKWRPITHCPSICDEDGYLSGIKKDSDLGEIEAEMRAQIALAVKYVKNVSHVTDHMAWTFSRPELGELFIKVAAEFGLFYQGGKSDADHGIQSLGMLMGQKNREEIFIQLLEKMEKGKTYWVIEHPAIDDSEMSGIYLRSPEEDNGGDRQDVTTAFTSPKVVEWIKSHNIQLVGFKEAYDLWEAEHK